ncbi:MAG: ankyrin repeat domain-containing protein [Chlamydiales bacterium]|nr:ankyrin repeat domain-containing protein [Chlamydiales bacterium]
MEIDRSFICNENHYSTNLRDKDAVKVENHLLVDESTSASYHIPDSEGLTPFQRAIIGGKISQIKEMLQSSSELSPTLNQPDKFGVTDIQRAARSGNMEVVGLLISYVIENDIITNRETYFSAEELKACTARSDMAWMASLPIEKIAFPLTIAQNFCNVMIRMADGKVLKLRNVDVVQIREYLMSTKYGDGWVSDHGANVLTTYLNPGHGYLRLKCRTCDYGKPYNKNRGFYPTGKKTPEAKAHTVSIVANLGMSLALDSTHLPVSPRKFLTTPVYATVLGVGAGLTVLPLDVAKQYFRQLKSLAQDLVINKYMLFREQTGSVVDDHGYEKDSDFNNLLKVTFYLTDDQARKALRSIENTEHSCKNDPQASCRYYFTSENCVDFVQNVFSDSELAGEIMDYVTDEQVGYGHLHTFTEIPENKALEYAYVRSRGWQYYLQSALHKSLCAPPKHHFVAISDLQGTVAPMSKPVVNDDDVLSVPNYQGDLAGNVALAFVLTKITQNVFKSLKNFWISHTGPEASLEETKEFCERAQVRIDKKIDDLTNLGEALDAMDLSPKNHHLQNARIDLMFEAVNLEQKFKRLGKSRSQPTKKLLASSEHQLAVFLDRCKTLLGPL